MASVNVSHELEVIEKFESIMHSSLGSESVYIRTKETLQALIADGSLSSKEKAEIVSNVLNNLNSTLVSAGLSTALQWAAKERDIELDKLKLEKELDILQQDILLRTAQVEKMAWDSIATQAQTIRMYGTPIVLNGVVTSLAAAG